MERIVVPIASVRGVHGTPGVGRGVRSRVRQGRDRYDHSTNGDRERHKQRLIDLVDQFNEERRRQGRLLEDAPDADGAEMTVVIGGLPKPKSKSPRTQRS
jgi:hypothetical protein